MPGILASQLNWYFRVRYPDDFVVGFHNKSDAERRWRLLGERLAEFGLELHLDKTRLLEFGRYAQRSPASAEIASEIPTLLRVKSPACSSCNPRHRVGRKDSPR